MIRWVLGAVLLAPSASWAQAFVRTQIDDTGVCIYWPKRIYTFHVDAAGSSQTPEQSEFDAIDAAFESWQTAANLCSDFQFVEGDRVADPQVGYVKGATDNQNVITFRETSCDDVPLDDPCRAQDDCANTYRCWDHDPLVIALTTTTFDVKSGAILDADIELNAAPQYGGPGFLFTTVSSPPCTYSDVGPDCVATDVQNTVTHEIGHVIGLAHTDRAGSTMAADAELGETGKRVIDFGTAQGLCAIYPPDRPSSSACDLSHAISDNVIASSAGTDFGCSAGAGGAGACWLGGLTALALALAHRRRPGDRRV